MHQFDGEEHKRQELEELKKTREEVARMPEETMKEEIEHIVTTIGLAESAIKHSWFPLFQCHKATIAAGMDLLFDRLSS